MSASIALAEGQTEQVDCSALLLMLSYIEAECRRLGATEAADHAALAASLVPAAAATGRGRPPAAGRIRPRRGIRLH